MPGFKTKAKKANFLMSKEEMKCKIIRIGSERSLIRHSRSRQADICIEVSTPAYQQVVRSCPDLKKVGSRGVNHLNIDTNYLNPIYGLYLGKISTNVSCLPRQTTIYIYAHDAIKQ